MAYALGNALFQWDEGQRRVRDDPRLEVAVADVVRELRRRLGSTFTVEELAALYAGSTDWALDAGRAAGSDAAAAVDAAFFRYAREASDFAGGRHHPTQGG